MPLAISSRQRPPLPGGGPTALARAVPPEVINASSGPRFSDPGRGLPRTRSFQRRKPVRLWWLALAIAVTVNLGVVVGLAQVSHLHGQTVEPPLAVRSMHQVEPPPPPPPEEQREAREQQPEEAVPVALPSLDLPSASPTSSLTLPSLGSLDATFDLPLGIPAFTTVGAADGPPVAALGGGTGPAFDAPPELETSLDLQRYYPRAAKLRGVTGTTRVHLSIDLTGKVIDAQILESTPAGVFEEATLRMVRTFHFRPATRAGKPVAALRDIPIAWTIK